MSSAVSPAWAAPGRPFIFDEISRVVTRPAVSPQPTGAELFGGARPPQRAVLERLAALQDARLAGITPASRLAIRPAPAMASSGIAALDVLTGGLPRGCLTEICGPASSGRTTILLSALAAATRRGEYCALVDAGDTLDPRSAADAGVDLRRLLWVRCGDDCGNMVERRDIERKADRQRKKSPAGAPVQAGKNLEHMLRAADLLLESGGFGLIALDFGDLPPQGARWIPMTTWFRFSRAVEHTPAVLLAIERQSIAGSCSSLLLNLGAAKVKRDDAAPAHAQLLTKLEITAEIARSRLERKPPGSAQVTFASKTAWAG